MRPETRFTRHLSDFDLTEPDSKKEYNLLLFSPVSHVYSRITRALSFGRDEVWKAELVASLPPFSGPRILDIACGPGDLTFRLSRRYPSGRITGVDLNPEMLGRAGENLRRLPADAGEHIDFAEGDMNALAFPDESFDAVTGGYALRNAPDLRRALGEIHRVLKPGGVAGFLDFSRSSGPLLGRIQVGLLRFWGRLWGRIYHGNPEVYGYIAESLSHFPDNDAFLQLLDRSGFDVVTYRPLFLGFLHLTMVRKR